MLFQHLCNCVCWLQTIRQCLWSADNFNLWKKHFKASLRPEKLKNGGEAVTRCLVQLQVQLRLMYPSLLGCEIHLLRQEQKERGLGWGAWSRSSCETQPLASIGWVALPSLFGRSSFVPHPWHLFSSPVYDVSDHTNHTWCMCGGIWWCLDHVWWCLVVSGGVWSMSGGVWSSSGDVNGYRLIWLDLMYMDRYIFQCL